MKPIDELDTSSFKKNITQLTQLTSLVFLFFDNLANWGTS